MWLFRWLDSGFLPVFRVHWNQFACLQNFVTVLAIELNRDVVAVWPHSDNSAQAWRPFCSYTISNF